jgi:hypothetical protein
VADEKLTDLYSALDSASTVMALSSQDWGAAGDFAWLYGIFVGWDNDPTGGDVDQDGGALDELATRFRWDAETVARLRRLRAAVAAFDINAVGDLAGRLLPSGGEVSTQWAVRWHLVGGGTDEQDCYRNARETAEQRARRLAANPPMGAVRGEALKRVKYIGPWSPVVSDNSEVPNEAS